MAGLKACTTSGDALDQPIEIARVGRDADRRAHGTNGSSAQARPETGDAELLPHALPREPRGDAERVFGRSGVAEAPAANGHAELASARLDEFVRHHTTVAHDIKCHDATTRLVVGGPVEADPIAQFSELAEERLREACDVARHVAHA